MDRIMDFILFHVPEEPSHGNPCLLRIGTDGHHRHAQICPSEAPRDRGIHRCVVQQADHFSEALPCQHHLKGFKAQRVGLRVFFCAKEQINKLMRYPQQLGRSWKVFVPEPSGTLSALCTGHLSNFVCYLHRNHPELHRPSEPEPSEPHQPSAPKQSRRKLVLPSSFCKCH